MLGIHPALPNVAKILHRLQPVLQSSRRCQEAIGEVPMVAFRRPKCLKVPITPKIFFQGKEYLHFSEQNAEKIF